MRRRWDIAGAVAGGLLGAADYALFVASGSVSPHAAAVGLAGSFALLGYVGGRLFMARERARRDAATIEAQLRQLERAQEQLMQQEKLAAIGRLAAGVAHEVRNPLGVIRSSASMLKEGFEPGEDAYRACGFICEEIDRLNGLITALLTFARPSSPRLAAVCLDDVVDRALRLAAQELDERDLALSRERTGDVPALEADADLLSQVVLGLLLNAVQASQPGGRIALRTGVGEGRVRLEVADAGSGVAPGDAPQIFEPFFTTKESGTGLGLPMALRLVESHGGRLELVPGAGAGPGGRGACFRVELPLARKAA